MPVEFFRKEPNSMFRVVIDFWFWFLFRTSNQSFSFVDLNNCSFLTTKVIKKQLISFNGMVHKFFLCLRNNFIFVSENNVTDFKNYQKTM